MNRSFRTAELTQMALLTALLCISAYIVIPLPFTPVSLTAQTLMVNLIALLLTPQQAAFTIGAYILLGLAGLPVFSRRHGRPWKALWPYRRVYYVMDPCCDPYVCSLKGNTIVSAGIFW